LCRKGIGGTRNDYPPRTRRPGAAASRAWRCRASWQERPGRSRSSAGALTFQRKWQVMIRKLILPLAVGATLAVSAGTAWAAPAPVVTSVTPAADTTGSQVVVSGSNLTLPPKLKPDKILFGQAEAIVNSCAPLTGAASSCNVTVPPQCPGTPSRVDVRVIVNGLESAISSGDGFTYTDSGQGTPSPSPTGCATKSPSPSPSVSSSGSGSPSATPTASSSSPGSPGPSPTVTSSSPATSPVPLPSGPPATGEGGASVQGSHVVVDTVILVALVLGAGLAGSAVRRRRQQ
jgi:hypothetical protein